MTHEDLKQIGIFCTAQINAAAAADADTARYIYNCLKLFYSGNYGMIGAEDTAYNNADLQDGHGHILGRYERRGILEHDIYIESHVNADKPLEAIDYNNTMIMYVDER